MTQERVATVEQGHLAFWPYVSRNNLSVQPLQESVDAWNQIVSLRAPVAYTYAMVGYQQAYMRSHLASFQDLSQVFYQNGQPIAVWPLCMRLTQEGWEVGSNEGAVLPPLFAPGISERVQKMVIEQCFATLDALCHQADLNAWEGRESVETVGMSLWHRALMEHGASSSIRHEVYVDLSRDLAALKANLRKSYKSLLTAGMRLWSVNVHTHIDPEEFAEFRALHLMVAGRATRSLESWQLQEAAINQGDAFLVTLRDESGKLVGGGLFHVSRSHGEYAVGVYDRSLFDKPLGHVVQFTAIEQMKQLGLRWYRIGDRPYPNTVPHLTPKEESIAYFKEGFATHFFLRLHSLCPRSSTSSDTSADEVR